MCLAGQSAASRSGWLSVCLFMLAVDVAGWLGCGRYCLGYGQAEFGCPALDVRPEPVVFVEILFAGEVGEDHRGDGGVAVQGLAG